MCSLLPRQGRLSCTSCQKDMSFPWMHRTLHYLVPLIVSKLENGVSNSNLSDNLLQSLIASAPSPLIFQYHGAFTAAVRPRVGRWILGCSSRNPTTCRVHELGVLILLKFSNPASLVFYKAAPLALLISYSTTSCSHSVLIQKSSRNSTAGTLMDCHQQPPVMKGLSCFHFEIC